MSVHSEKPRRDEPDLENQPEEMSEDNREIEDRKPNLGEMDEDPDQLE